MNNNHYREEVYLLIYALIRDDHYVYIGKTKSPTLASVYSRNIHGHCAATRNVFGIDLPDRPNLYLLKSGSMTQAIGYRYLLAYIRYFSDHGYTVVNHQASIFQAENLEGDTIALHREISKFPLTQLLQEGYIKKPSVRLAPMKNLEVLPAPKSKKELSAVRLCIRLTPSEKQAFSQFADGLHLSQRDTVLYLLKKQQSQLLGCKGWLMDQTVSNATRRQAQKIQKLENEIETFKQDLTQEARDMSLRMTKCVDIWKQGILTILSTVMIPSCPMPLPCARYSEHVEAHMKDNPFFYPEEEHGLELLYPSTILFGKARPVARFVFGRNEKGQRRKYRFYPSRYFAGLGLPDNRYWIVGSVWLVGWVRAGDGAADLVFAFPLTGLEQPQTMLAPDGGTAHEDKPSLDQMIHDAQT